MKKIFIILISLASICTAHSQQDPASLIADAKKAIDDQDYNQAIKLYESIGASGSTDVYYNLGNLYYQKNQLGKAALNYEKALKLDAGHKDAKHNLAILREKTDIDIIPVDDMFIIRWWNWGASLFIPNVWLILTLLVAMFWVVAVYFWLIASGFAHKKKAFTASCILPIALIKMIALGYTAKTLSSSKVYAIVMSDDSDMHEGADERSPISKDLQAGNKVKIIDQLQDWIKVGTADTETGWLQQSEVERI